jgi:hypothetical protein
MAAHATKWQTCSLLVALVTTKYMRPGTAGNLWKKGDKRDSNKMNLGFRRIMKESVFVPFLQTLRIGWIYLDMLY